MNTPLAALIAVIASLPGDVALYYVFQYGKHNRMAIRRMEERISLHEASIAKMERREFRPIHHVDEPGN